jgi:hypothetical protein
MATAVGNFQQAARVSEFAVKALLRSRTTSPEEWRTLSRRNPEFMISLFADVDRGLARRLSRHGFGDNESVRRLSNVILEH